MTQALFATFIGIIVGVLVGLDFQGRFNLGTGAWTICAFTGGVIGFLAFKPAQIGTAFKRSWNKFTNWRWHLHDAEPQYKRAYIRGIFWESCTMVSALTSIQSVVFYPLHIIDRDWLTGSRISWQWVIAAIVLVLVSTTGVIVTPKSYSSLEEVRSNEAAWRRRFLVYCNPISISFWIAYYVILGALKAIQMIPWAIFVTLRFIKNVMLETIKYCSTHERLTVSMCAAIGATVGFFAGQRNAAVGLAVGLFVGFVLLKISQLLARHFMPQSE